MGRIPGTLALIIVLSVTLMQPSTVTAETLQARLIYIGDSSSSAYLGAMQGLKESNLQGQFLGQQYVLEQASLEDLQKLAESHPQAILADVDTKGLMAIAEALTNTMVFNIANEDDELRRRCLSNLLHVIPSRKMRNDAIAQWQKKNPGANVDANAWHPDFVKYAARDLNKRYKKTHDKAMDSKAWAGWAAVKMTSDSIAREQTTDAVTLMNYIKTSLTFDGQKGIAMDFRSTGQLRQPLLISEQEKLLGEAPVRGVVDTSNLDSLGTIECQ